MHRLAFVAMLLAISLPAIAAEPSYEELQQQLKQLQSRLDALEQKQSQSSAEVAKVVDQIVADAEKRSKLLVSDGGVTAGYDKGFFIKSEDGNYVMRPSVLFQFRNIVNIRTGDDEGTESGFEMRRLRPRIDGNVFTQNLTYSVVFDVSRTSGTTSLLDAWAQYQINTDWAVKFGQFRNSWVHEGDVPDSNQLALERSLVDAILGGSQTDRVQGIEIIYGAGKKPIRLVGAFDDGANSKNTNFQNVATDFGFSGRAEYKFFGNWADYRDFNARLNKENLFVIGAGFDWAQSGGSDVVRTTVDAQYETTTRWSFYGELNGVQNFDDGEDIFDWGGLVQAGYAIDQKWEPFIRYDVVVLDDDGEDAYNEFTAGVNYYLFSGKYGPKAKLTFDVLFLPDGAPSDQTGVGVLASEDAEYVLRTQFQLIL